MKKIFSFLAATVFLVVLVAGATTKGHCAGKLKAASSVATAMAGVGMVKQSTSRNAAVYNYLKGEYPNNPVIAPDFIRMEAYLVNGKSEYEFFHKLLGNESATENKLNEQDAFRVTDIGIFLLQESTTVPGIGVLQTYPNPIVFPDESGAIQTAHLEHIYNGRFVGKIGDTTYLPGMPVQACRVVNTAQQTNATTNRSERHGSDGYIGSTPQYTLKGRENNSLKLVVPANSAQKVESVSGTTGYKIKVVCILLGFKITGAGNTDPISKQLKG